MSDTSVPEEEARNKKKRSKSDSPPQLTRPTKIPAPGSPTNTSLSAPDFTTPNPFSVLSIDPEQPSTTNTAIPKPPPIFVRNLANFNLLCNALSAVIGGNNFTCQSQVRQTIIRTADSDSYRGAINYLKSQGASYHTYQVPEERGFRVVIRGLHHTTPTDVIHKELEEKGFDVRTVTNAHHPITKTPLPLFFVELQPSKEKNTNREEIFNLKNLYYSTIRVEEPHKRKEIVQCHRCQNYGHTRSYCNHPPRCVRCAGSHESATCIKTRDTAATCVLCGGSHPANFKGCTTYQDLQRLRRPSQPPRQPPRDSLPPADLLQGPALPQRPSHPVQRPQPKPRQRQRAQPLPPAFNIQPPSHSYAKVVHGPRRVPPPPPTPQAGNLPDFTSQFSSFLGQFTAVANQLIIAISSLVTLLQNSVPR